MAENTDPDADSDSDPDNRLGTIIYEVTQALAVVFVIGVIIFLVTGTWPSMVVVNGQSMQPNLDSGSLVVVTAPERFGPGDSVPQQSGVVTGSNATESDYRSFGAPGDVIVFQSPSGNQIVHRALIHVEKGENWRGRVNSDYLAGDTCNEIRFCPAPHAGFITKGDGNPYADQVYGVPPVKSENLTGVARWKIPFFGQIRQLIPISAFASASPSPVTAD